MNEVNQDELLSQIGNIWKKVLGIDEIKVQHSFFELGGGSLQVIKLLYLVEKEFGVEINLLEFFSSPTLDFVVNKISSYKSSETFSF